MQLEILFQTSPTLLTVYFSFCPLGGAMGLFFPPKQALFPAATFCLLTSNPSMIVNVQYKDVLIGLIRVDSIDNTGLSG